MECKAFDFNINPFTPGGGTSWHCRGSGSGSGTGFSSSVQGNVLPKSHRNSL